MSFQTDPKYLVRHFIQTSPTHSPSIFNTLFDSRFDMRKFITKLQKKYGQQVKYKILTILDCYGSENSETWDTITDNTEI